MPYERLYGCVRILLNTLPAWGKFLKNIYNENKISKHFGKTFLREIQKKNFSIIVRPIL